MRYALDHAGHLAGRTVMDGFKGDLIPAGHLSEQGARLTVPRRRASRPAAGQRVASGHAHPPCWQPPHGLSVVSGPRPVPCCCRRLVPGAGQIR